MKKTKKTTKNKQAFTLIELLIVIGIIAILAAAVIIAINPGQQFAQARDATRRSHLNSLSNAILSYQIESYGAFPTAIMEAKGEEICNTNIVESTECGDLIDLSFMTPSHISSIPVDPRGGISETHEGTGYRIVYSSGNIGIKAPQAEAKNSIKTGTWSMTDPRDKQTYAIELIGGQLWMAENLNYDNGCSEVVWVNESDEGWCGYYNNDEATYSNRGLLYQWSAAMVGDTTAGAQGICPDGWHLPTDAEYQDLEEYLGMTNAGSTSWRYTGDVGAQLKADSTHWSDTCPNASRWCDGTGGTGESGHHNVPVPEKCYTSGFNALPGGSRRELGSFANESTHARFWSSTGSSASAQFRGLRRVYSGVFRLSVTTARGYSVRCLRDN